MRHIVSYSLDKDVIKAIIEAAKLQNKSSSRFIEDTMKEKAAALISKELQSQSLTKSSEEAYKTKSL